MDEIWQNTPYDITRQIIAKCDIDTKLAFKIIPKKIKHNSDSCKALATIFKKHQTNVYTYPMMFKNFHQYKIDITSSKFYLVTLDYTDMNLFILPTGNIRIGAPDNCIYIEVSLCFNDSWQKIANIKV